MFYERHHFADTHLKILYHMDTVFPGKTPGIPVHFHENIELLLFVKGSGTVRSDNTSFCVHEGEMAVIAPNRLHSVTAVEKDCTYYCLIIDRNQYCADFKENALESMPLKTDAPELLALYRRIFEALDKHPRFFRQEIRSYIGLLVVGLLRQADPNDNVREEPGAYPGKTQMVKNAIQYMNEHFAEEISVDDISASVGFSKYYFCRTFKEITGQTPLWNLNYIRCQAARALMQDGSGTITECAIHCGFNNPSYFCKIYKRYFGRQPREDYAIRRETAVPRVEHINI